MNPILDRLWKAIPAYPDGTNVYLSTLTATLNQPDWDAGGPN